MNVKQVIVIRRKYPDPTEEGKFRKIRTGKLISQACHKIRTGKLISQACHASMKIFFDRMSKVYWGERDSPTADQDYDWVSELTPEMTEWKEGAFKKVCVYVDHEEDLLNIAKQAEEANLPVALITDSGLTEFNGEQTNTCCAIGPAKAEEIDKITGNLPLL
jgi:PTH2 family peptidyl-tRNA hydrolase